jgi:hypothetical protein
VERRRINAEEKIEMEGKRIKRGSKMRRKIKGEIRRREEEEKRKG